MTKLQRGFANLHFSIELNEVLHGKKDKAKKRREGKGWERKGREKRREEEKKREEKGWEGKGGEERIEGKGKKKKKEKEKNQPEPSTLPLNKATARQSIWAYKSNEVEKKH